MSTKTARTSLDAGREGEFAAASAPPTFNPEFVRRPRLVRTLLKSPPTRLVLLAAPAGYSKTTCLAEWMAADDRPFAWVAAQPRHDDPALLIASIAEAMGEIEPVDEEVLAALKVPRPSISGVALPRLADSLRTRRTPFVLAIDDVHAITAPEAVAVLETLLGHLPAGSQLALASRTDSPMSLGRHRANRELVELKRYQLALTREESAMLLATLGLKLDDSQIDAIVERTEGWPAALYLAGLSLVEQPDTAAAVSSFAGDDRIVVEYLRDEFLAAMDPVVVRFLTRSSILEELSGPACDAVLERTGSGKTLKELARSNFLVVPLDRRDGRYRYHHLLGEMLRAELRRSEPRAEIELHARASRWYARNSNPEAAVEHAISAGDLERAADLIWAAFPELAGRGRVATIEAWLDGLGEGPVTSSTTLALASAHRHLALGEGDHAARWAAIAREGARTRASNPETVVADIYLLAATLASDGIARMGEDAERASDVHPAWQSASYFYRGVAKHLAGDPEAAAPVLREAARRSAVAVPLMQTLALAQQSTIAIGEGDWDLALRLVEQAREQVRRCGLTGYPSVAIVYATCALVYAHEGRVEQAQADAVVARRLLPMLREFPPWYEAEARLVLAGACLRLDELAEARSLLDEAERFLERTPDATLLREWLDASRSDLARASTELGDDAPPLTNAELRTLQYLPSHLSFREIGERIHVSPNTVKTQAQAVYRKLEASSRAEAVDKARGAGLLGEDPLGEA